MNDKKILIFSLFAILLTNASILLTLYFSGHFSDEDEVEEVVPEGPKPTAYVVGDTTDVEQLFLPHPFLVRELYAAKPICDDKLASHLKGRLYSHYYDNRMSYFDKETDKGTWRLMYNIEFLSAPSEPGYKANATCTVVAVSGSVSSFIVLKK
ncbi:MAG: hypothetical protein K6L73_03750 [Cellvibrionaceae bacterium]